MAGTEALVTLNRAAPAPRRAAHERAARRDPVGASCPGHAAAVDPRPRGRPRDLSRSRRDRVRTAHRRGAARLPSRRRHRRGGVRGLASPSARASAEPAASAAYRRRSRRCTQGRPTRRCSPGPRGGARTTTRCVTSRMAGWATATRPASPELRRELADYLGRVRAASVDASSLIVTTGASQALALLATALRQAGETAIGVEDPGSEPIRTHLAAHGLRPVPIPVDGDGLVVDELAATDVRAVARDAGPPVPARSCPRPVPAGRSSWRGPASAAAS